MTVAPLPHPRTDRLGTAVSHARPPPSKRSFANHRNAVVWSKRLLPVVAMLLLASVALWPQISEQFNHAHITYRRGGLSADVQAGKLLNVRYRGQDGRGRPYTVTADGAAQSGTERIDLARPKGDVVSENGSWTYGESLRGVYHQHAGQLDMSGDVVLYRDNGVTMRTQSAAIDLKQGAAAGNEPTHAEGPFGTLDAAAGFALLDKGNIIQFDGKSRLVLNGTRR